LQVLAARGADGVTLVLVFQDALREIVDKTEGGVAGLIMDSEGIAVDTYARDGAPFDITTIGIEFGVVLGSIKRAAESLEAGKAQEVAIGTDKLITLIRTLGDSYFLAVAIKPDGNLGKGRFLMRTAAPKLLAELG
jgi:predicted regulator of Ras-like GTPase activity (Roadblock/LC7/MglB family)